MSVLSLIRKEFALQVISAKFSVMTLLVLSLVLVSVIVMHGDYKLRLENYELLKPDGSETVALKCPTLTSVLVKGVDERMGQSVQVDVLGKLNVGRSQRAANRLFTLFQEVDFHFIALVVLSLAAVIFSFDMISREKRNGTMKLMLAGGIGRSRILFAKWLGALLVVAIQALLALLVFLLYLYFVANEAIGAETYLRTGLFSLAVLFYLAVFTGLGLLISCLTHRPAVSLVFALLVWALLVFVAPNGAALAGSLISGGEDLEQLNNRVEEVWIREIFLFLNEEGRYESWPEYYRHVKGPVADVYRHYLNLAEARVGWVRTLSYISPAGPFSFASWASAGTGPADELFFKREVLRYQDGAVEDAFQINRMRRGRIGEQGEFKARLFTYEDRPLTTALWEEIIPGLAALALMAVILFSLGFFAFVRYDVR